MIAEPPALALQEEPSIVTDPPRTLSLNRVAATLQVLLAARRGARSEDEAYWYTIGRGL
jgi:hypothetical protein